MNVVKRLLKRAVSTEFIHITIHVEIIRKFKIKNIQITRGAPPCTPTDQKLWYQLFFGNS